MGCLVCLHGQRCTGYWYHVLHIARSRLFWPIASMDYHRLYTCIQQIQTSGTEDPNGLGTMAVRASRSVKSRHSRTPSNLVCFLFPPWESTLISVRFKGFSTHSASTSECRQRCHSHLGGRLLIKSQSSLSLRMVGITGVIDWCMKSPIYTRKSTRSTINTALHSVLLRNTPLPSKSWCLVSVVLVCPFCGACLRKTFTSWPCISGSFCDYSRLLMPILDTNFLGACIISFHSGLVLNITMYITRNSLATMRAASGGGTTTCQPSRAALRLSTRELQRLLLRLRNWLRLFFFEAIGVGGWSCGCHYSGVQTVGKHKAGLCW